MRTSRTIILFLVLAQGVTSCNARSPVAPSPVSPVPPPASPVPPPAPQHQLRGTVHDTADRPLAGVEIAAWSGPEAYATSDDKGEFTFTGPVVERFVGTDIFAAWKEGYVTEKRSLASGLNFVLEPVVTSANTAVTPP